MKLRNEREYGVGSLVAYLNDAVTDAKKTQRFLFGHANPGFIQIFLGKQEFAELKKITYSDAPPNYDPIKYWSELLGPIFETDYESHIYVYLK